jgi:uncharacterized membrane protein
MMNIMGLISLLLTILLITNTSYGFFEDKFLIVYIGLGVEYFGAFLNALIFYGILCTEWEGYYNHKGLKMLHYFTLVFLSAILPHGDFLLHFGYRQRGYNKKTGIEEPFPDGFDIPKEAVDYQGYLRPTKGGFFFFFVAGYSKCFYILLRMAMTLTFYFTNGSYAFLPIYN